MYKSLTPFKSIFSRESMGLHSRDEILKGRNLKFEPKFQKFSLIIPKFKN